VVGRREGEGCERGRGRKRSEDCYYYCYVVVLFGTLKVQSFILAEVSDCALLIVVTSSTFLKRRDMLKGKKAVSTDHQNLQPSIYIDKCTCTHTCIRSTCILRFSRSGFFRLAKCPSYTWAHIKYPSSLCVCTRVHKHTPTHHHNTRKNGEIKKINPLSLPLSKHCPTPATSANHEQGEKTPHFQSPTTHACWSCDKRACSKGIGQYKSTKCTYMSAYVHRHACAYTCICIHIH